jgi:Antibiotic biosynthesis monooxygenase
MAAPFIFIGTHCEADRQEVDHMSGPLIMISRSRIKPGHRETYEAHLRQANEMVESEEPRVIAFNSWTSEDGTEVSTVHFHPDADSLDAHLKLYFERLAGPVAESVDSYELDIWGVASESALSALRSVPGMQVRVLPVHEAGFIRLGADAVAT